MPTCDIKTQKMQTDKVIPGILSWNTSKTIQYHIEIGLSRAILITLDVHTMNISQKLALQKGGRSMYKGQ